MKDYYGFKSDSAQRVLFTRALLQFPRKEIY